MAAEDSEAEADTAAASVNGDSSEASHEPILAVTAAVADASNQSATPMSATSNNFIDVKPAALGTNLFSDISSQSTSNPFIEAPASTVVGNLTAEAKVSSPPHHTVTNPFLDVSSANPFLDAAPTSSVKLSASEFEFDDSTSNPFAEDAAKETTATSSQTPAPSTNAFETQVAPANSVVQPTAAPPSVKNSVALLAPRPPSSPPPAHVVKASASGVSALLKRLGLTLKHLKFLLLLKTRFICYLFRYKAYSNDNSNVF